MNLKDTYTCRSFLIYCFNFMIKTKNKLHKQYSFFLGLQKTFKYLNYVFCPNHLYEHAIGTLELHHCLTIIGPPGSGKTITALQLAYRKCVGGGRSRVYFCRTVEELESTAAGKEDAYIIVDDWLDRYMYYPSTLRPDIAHLTKFYDEFVKSGKVHLVLTAQKDKWRMIEDLLSGCDMFNPQSLLLITGLHKKEQRDIILHHFSHFEIKEGDKKKLAEKIKDEKEFSFPVIIDLICSNERLRVPNTLNLIFKDGFCKILKTFFANWFQENDIVERKSFCILVFAALLGGKISTSDFKSIITGPLLERVCKFMCLPNEQEVKREKQVSTEEDKRRKKELSDEDNQAQKQPYENWGKLLFDNRRLRGCLYQISDTHFIFQHSSLFRFVLSFIKEKGEQFFIENVNIKVLMTQCWIDKGILEKLWAENEEIPPKYPVGSVVLSTSVLKTLAKRIRSEKEHHIGYDITEWDNHIFMSEKTFKKMWEDVESEKSHQSQH